MGHLASGVGSGAMVSIPNLMKFRSGILNFMWGHITGIETNSIVIA
jgi:hypothetical protein